MRIGPITKAKLINLDVSHYKEFPCHELTPCKVISVIDGDTIKIGTLDCNFIFNLRILGVDCPESKRNKAKSEEEYIAGNRVTEIVKSWLEEDNYIAGVRCVKKCKYCRYVGDLYLLSSETFLSKRLLEEKLAQAYDGRGARPDWTPEYLKYIKPC